MKVEKYCHIASFEEIKENDFNLNIPRYIDTFEVEDRVDLEIVKDSIKRIEEQVLIVKKNMEEYLEELVL